MKLSFWNWIHLLVPYFIALYCYNNWGESFLGWLFLGYFLTEMITMVPYMDRDVKTGKSFKTKYGRIEEYQTVKGESANDMGNMTAKIHLAHFSGIILLIIYGVYSIFSSMNVNQSNSSTYDKNEDTLAVSSSEYTGENYSDSNISEYNIEDSTNLNASQNNAELDTAESFSAKVFNTEPKLNSNYTKTGDSITEKDFIDMNDKFMETEDKLSSVRDQLLLVLSEKEQNIFWSKQRKWLITMDEEADKVKEKYKDKDDYLGRYHLYKYYVDQCNRRIKEIQKIYNSKQRY
jgi:hypothetical protein